MKPFALPKQFQSLSEDQLAELHAWLDDPALSYKIIRAKLFDLHGITISDATLCRYNERRELADRVVNHEDSAKNIRAFLAVQNAQPIPYEEAGLALIPQRAFELACASKINASTLAALQRVFHYKTALAHTERRLVQNDQRIAQADRRLLQNDKRNEIAEATLQLKREESARRASSPSPLQGERAGVRGSSDHLGPFARNWDEVGDRVCKQFGITREELIRRAELRRTWKNPNDYQNAPAPAPDPKPGAAHVASLSCAPQAHDESSVETSGEVTASVSPSVSPTPDASFHSNHGCSSKREPLALHEIPVLETNNPTAGNPASPLEALAAHNAQFFKAIGAQAAAELNALNARTTHSKPENETINH
jgi:hypothetical protein